MELPHECQGLKDLGHCYLPECALSENSGRAKTCTGHLIWDAYAAGNDITPVAHTYSFTGPTKSGWQSVQGGIQTLISKYQEAKPLTKMEVRLL